MATGTLMAEDQVSLGFLFPKMILRPPQRAILISACGPKSFRPSYSWGRGECGRDSGAGRCREEKGRGQDALSWDTV